MHESNPFMNKLQQIVRIHSELSGYLVSHLAEESESGMEKGRLDRKDAPGGMY